MIQIVLPDFELDENVKKFHLDISFVIETDEGEEVIYEHFLEGSEVHDDE